MANITLDFNTAVRPVRVMHAVNNGPFKASAVEQTRGNFDTFKAARIPYVRNHDASFCSQYGGEHTVDVHAVFPDFTANPYDERSYDFTLTDEYLQTIVDAGSKVFYRLGSKIEHWVKKYGTIVPADFHKWAVVCEHIIRHYNEGWANGFHFGIEYWEIWNEPDGKKANGDQPNWSGTPEEFYELYTEAATHLKSRFPHLMIGGPALSWVENKEWFDIFLAYLTKDGRRVPLDFFSWHGYAYNIDHIALHARVVREKLDAAGYTQTKSVLDEWNYLEGWTDKFISSIKAITGMRGAAFTAAVMTACQHLPVDMLMYYDARPSVFNGLFDFYTMEPLKGYYPFVLFSELYALETETQSTSDDADVRVIAAAKDGKKAAMISFFALDRNAAAKEVTIDLGCEDAAECLLLDKDKTLEPVEARRNGSKLSLIMQPDSVLYVRMNA